MCSWVCSSGTSGSSMPQFRRKAGRTATFDCRTAESGLSCFHPWSYLPPTVCTDPQPPDSRLQRGTPARRRARPGARVFRDGRVSRVRDRRLRQQFDRRHGERRASEGRARGSRAAQPDQPRPQHGGAGGAGPVADFSRRRHAALARTASRDDGVLRGGKVCGGGASLPFDLAEDRPVRREHDALWNSVSALFGLAAGSYVFCYRQAWEEVGGFDEDVYAGEEIYFLPQAQALGPGRGGCASASCARTRWSRRRARWSGTASGTCSGRCLMMLRPGAVRSREACSLWYSRPDVP